MARRNLKGPEGLEPTKAWQEMRQEGYVVQQVHSATDWQMLCPKGHTFKSNKHSIMTRGIRCGVCTGRDAQANFLNIKAKIEAEGWLVVEAEPSEYRRFGYKMLVQNPQGERMHMTGDSWERGHRSVRGSVRQNRHRTIQEVQDSFKARGYECLENEYRGAKHKMKARCPQGHEFLIHWNHWSRGVGCSVCFGTPKLSIQDIQARLNLIDPKQTLQVIERRDLPVRQGRVGALLRCEKGHEWLIYTTYLSRSRAASLRCIHCFPQSSNAELDLLEALRAYYPSAHKSKVLGFELDIYIPEQKMAVEYCGLYWHSSLFKKASFHFDKFKKCQEAGIKLYTIFEDEWISHRDKVLARLLPPQTILNANNLRVETLSREMAKAFEQQYHLQGPSSLHADQHVGLWLEDKLVASASFGPHQQDREKYVLQRLTYSARRIIGGLEKMLAHAQLPEKVLAWSDNRWSTGSAYQKAGWEKEADLKPDYTYCVTGEIPQRLPRQTLRKAPKTAMEEVSEQEVRAQQGYLRIYDCGKIRWVFNPRR